MDSFTQSLILCGLMVGVVYICIHMVWIQPKLTRRRADARRVLELAAASIQSVSHHTPTGAEDLVGKILSFRSLAARSVDLKTARGIEAVYFQDGWRDAHRVLAEQEQIKLQQLGQQLARREYNNPEKVAVCLSQLHEVALQYQYHFMEGDMERPDAREVIAASRSSLGARFPLLAHYWERAEARFHRAAERFYKMLLGGREISK